MIKSFLILTSFTISLIYAKQIVLVVADDINTSVAKLECWEDNNIVFDNIKVNIGKNGLGWGIGIKDIPHKEDEIKKYEGDKRAPIGIFELSDIFGYKYDSNYSLPYLYTSKNLICVDDSNSNFYNNIIESNSNERSFEYMRRKDELYKLGIVVKHNPNANNKRGSCIFIHIERGENIPTVGCTSMNYSNLKKIVKWLDKEQSPILIQISKKEKERVKKLYPELESSSLLK
jgi:L,D-peptidoglycan transpeptidase YkuD (ErfK/YbiS/YcfS/YnhG family)